MASSTPQAATGHPQDAGGTVGFFERVFPDGRHLSGVTLASPHEVVLIKGSEHPVVVTGGIIICVAFDEAQHLADLMLRLVVSAEGALALWKAYGFKAEPMRSGAPDLVWSLGELTMPESELRKLEAKSGKAADPLAARVHALMLACPELRQRLDTWHLRTIVPITADRRQELLAARS